MSFWGNNYGIQGFVPPVDNGRLTSKEGPRKSFRTDNGKSASSFHRGVDIAPPIPGQKVPIKNAVAGKVIFAGKAGGYGNTVIVQSPDDVYIQYAHLDSIAVKAGDVLAAGQQMGRMGETGNSRGVHLDMIVAKGGKVINRNGGVVSDIGSSMLQRIKNGGGTPLPANLTRPTVQNSATQTAPTQPSVTTSAPPEVTDSIAAPTLDDPLAQVPNTKGANYDIFGTNSSVDARTIARENAIKAVQRAAEQVMGGSMFAPMPLDNGVARLFDTVELDDNQTNSLPQPT